MRLALTVIAALWWLSPAWAVTFYVDQATGSDSNSCTQAQNIATGKATINAGASCLVAGRGDTLIIRAGIYNEILNDVIPSGGGSWATATIVRAAQGEVATIQPTGAPIDIVVIGKFQARNYIIFQDMDVSGLSLNATACTAGIEIFGNDNSSHIRLDNVSLHDLPFGSGIDINTQGRFPEVLNSHIYNLFGGPGICGTTSAQGFYANSDDMLLEGNLVHDITGSGSNCFQVWQTATGPQFARARVRNNRMFNCGAAGIFVGFRADDSIIELNVISNSGGGIVLDGNRNSAWNNTVYNISGAAFRGNCNTAACQVKNNIFDGGTVTYDPGMDQSNNQTGCTDACYTNAAGGDFSLSATSLAKNAGIDVGLPCNGLCDQGAYEIWEHTSASIGGALGNTIVDMVFQGAYAPFRVPGNCVGWALLGSTCGATCTAIQPQAGNSIRMTVSCAPLGTDTLQVQYTGTTVTDRANNAIGGTYQPLHAVTFPVANNIGGGGTIPPAAGVVRGIFRGGVRRGGTQR